MSESREEELARLIAEQEREIQRAHNVYDSAVPLNKAVSNTSGGSTVEMGSFFAAQDDIWESRDSIFATQYQRGSLARFRRRFFCTATCPSCGKTRTLRYWIVRRFRDYVLCRPCARKIPHVRSVWWSLLGSRSPSHCQAEVNIGEYYRGVYCSRRGSIRVDGKVYCQKHAPGSVGYEPRILDELSDGPKSVSELYGAFVKNGWLIDAPEARASLRCSAASMSRRGKLLRIGYGVYALPEGNH
jgi:hypothetical protein